jgi:biofilm PGA synthesis protein PgaD
VLLIGWAEYNRARASVAASDACRDRWPASMKWRPIWAPAPGWPSALGCKAATLHMDDHARPIGIRREVV